MTLLALIRNPAPWETSVKQRSDSPLYEVGATVLGNHDRREVLSKLLAAALVVTTSWPRGGALAATLPLGRDRFLEISAKLCAVEIKDGFLGDAIQNALLDHYAANEFKRIAKILESATPEDVDHLIAISGLRELARSVVSAWYSGQVGRGEAARVLAYEEALAWPATRYAKAPGTCGEFGEWNAKPANAFDPGDRQ
jgi:hypothetical protein